MGSDSHSSIPLWMLLTAASVLIVLSLVFSAAESAFLSINKLRVRCLRNQKDRRALRVWKLLSDKERLINTLLVGNNIVNITLSSIITFVAVQVFGNAGVGIATFAATLLLLVFGEITPKTIATHHPEAIAFFFSGFISVLEVILSPLVFLLSGISRIFLALFGVDVKKNRETFTEEEIKTFIDVGSEQGVIEHNEKTMMHRVFKFTDLEAKDIMIPRKDIKAVPLDASFSDVIELSERFSVSRFPVYRKDIDDIVGILYIKDMLFFNGQIQKDRAEEFSVKKLMRPPLFILETKKMSSIQQMLRENRQSMAVVIDEYSGTYGVLTSEDIAREIFGTITDEYRSHDRHLELQAIDLQNREVSGLTRIGDINEHAGLHLDSSNCETLGGYVCQELGHIPVVGEYFVREGYRFTVSEMDDKRVSKIHVREVVPSGGE